MFEIEKSSKDQEQISPILIALIGIVYVIIPALQDFIWFKSYTIPSGGKFDFVLRFAKWRV